MSYDSNLFQNVSDAHYRDTSGGEALSVNYIGTYSAQDWWAALRVAFTPKVPLSAISFTLKTTGHQAVLSDAFEFGITTSTGTAQPVLNPYVRPGIPAEQKSSTAENYSVTITADLDAGTTYYLWVRNFKHGSFGRMTHAASNFYELNGTVKGIGHIDNGSAYGNYIPYRDTGTGWEQVIPYEDRGSGWELFG